MSNFEGMSRWLDVKTTVGQRVARQLGAIVATWLVVIAGNYMRVALTAGIPATFAPGNVLELSSALLGGWCAYVLFRRPSIPASALVLAMALVEGGARFLDTEATNIAIPLTALLFSAQALRGSIVARTIR